MDGYEGSASRAEWVLFPLLTFFYLVLKTEVANPFVQAE
jgi:hypothetical protein